jgi:hypothetical protein
MADTEHFIRMLLGLMEVYASQLAVQGLPPVANVERGVRLVDLGDVADRSENIADIINNTNNYLVNHSDTETKSLRLFVVENIPRLLLGYQAMRFPQILGEESKHLPFKEHLSRFPELISQTGLYLPVSACLRLIAVSLTDDCAKQALIDSGGLKAIISHTVDDPLNPLQRESAVFVMKVLTLNFPPAQAAVAKFMSSQ